MRAGITLKLFLAILVSCIVVTLAMGAAVRLMFERGFHDYVQERELRRAQVLGDVLGDIYREQGDWESLRDDSRQWWRLLRSATVRGRGDHGRSEHLAPPPPFFLLDADQRVVVGAAGPGASRPAALRHPVDVDGHVVGWLVVPRPGPSPDALDVRFQDRQAKATWVIGGLSVLLAALVSILLARSLLAPVRRIARATHALAAGDYSTRVHHDAHDELGRLAGDFNQLALTLEQNERLRRELLDDISHELRTPLAVLRGELEAVQDGVRTLTPQSLESFQAEVATLNKLIDDLQELTRVDTGALRYSMTRVDLGELVRQAGEAFRERVATRGLTLTLDVPPDGPDVQGDPQRLVQVLNNLMENSLRYTDAPGRVLVSVRRVADGREAELVVEDTAPGVPPDALPRLFERLYRVDPSRSRASGGVGLGLAISQRIVQAHQGRIEADGSPLGGLRVCVRLPLTVS